MSGSRLGDLARRHLVAVDVVVALLLAAVAVVALLRPADLATVDTRDADALGVALVVASNAAVAARRRWPLPAFAVTMTTSLAVVLLLYTTSAGIAPLLVLYTVAAERPRRVSLPAAVVAWLAVVVTLAVAPVPIPATDWIGNTLLLSTGWAVGRAVRAQRQRLAVLRERNAALEEARESQLRAALSEERSRIAREMHDVVAHSLAAMTVQASAARRLVRRDPDSAEQVLDAVQGAGRGALEELRRVLDLLQPGLEPAALRPQPGTADLPDLVESVRGLGLDVALAHEGSAVRLDPGVDLAAYRIVQESLTNALRHAGPARVTVRLQWRADRLDIAVEDDGRGAAALAEPVGAGADAVRASAGTGRGLRLLEERAGAYGGSLRAGPRAGGGFALRASLPLHQEDA
jgi:signal transduction histidine kinase